MTDPKVIAQIKETLSRKDISDGMKLIAIEMSVNPAPSPAPVVEPVACQVQGSDGVWRYFEMPRTAEAIGLVTRPLYAHPPRADLAPTGNAETPAAKWRAEGQPDPHGSRYDCERAALAMGDLTDDEMANAVYMYGDTMPDMREVLAGRAKMPSAYLTAAKDRIRWLSRKLAEASAPTGNANQNYDDQVSSSPTGNANQNYDDQVSSSPTGNAAMVEAAIRIVREECGKDREVRLGDRIVDRLDALAKHKGGAA